MQRPQIFLAHVSEDGVWVRAFYELLEAIGAKPWMAPLDILPGKKWQDAIREAILSSTFVVACLSRNSVAKTGYVQREFRLALDLCQEFPSDRVFLIPLRLDTSQVPNLQIGSLNLRDFQWNDMFATGSFDRLLSAIGLYQETAVQGMLRRYGDDCSISAVLGDLLGFDRRLAHPIAFDPGKGTLDFVLASLTDTLRLVPSPQTATLQTFRMPETFSFTAASRLATGGENLDTWLNQRDGSEMVVVPKGHFLMGDPETPVRFSNQLESGPFKSVDVPTFSISRCLITKRQYQTFLVDHGTTVERERIGEAPPDHPATNVSWTEANAYCAWAGGRLPSEFEWEKAARGIDGRPYPWGWEKPHEEYCNFGNPGGGTTPVRRYPRGVSPFGVYDMAGNTWEWCATQVQEASVMGRQLASEDWSSSEPLYVVKGGCFAHDASACRSAGRYYGPRDIRSFLWGFRLAVDGQQYSGEEL